jgi:hypothetical protein
VIAFIPFISLYLLFGVAFNFFYDKVIDKLELEENRLNLIERVWAGLLWPIATAVFFLAFIKSAFNDD